MTAARRAAKTDTSQPDIIQALTTIGCTVVNVSRVGDGMADLVAILPDGRVAILVECKTPGDVSFTADQIKFMVSLVQPAYRVAMTAEQAIAMISQIVSLEDAR